MPRFAHTTTRFAVFAAVLCLPTSASAQGAKFDSPSNQAQPDQLDQSEVAIALGHKGLRAFESGDFTLALSLFVEAQAAIHSPVFVLYQARSAKNLGQWQRALELYRSCAKEPLDERSPASWAASVRAAEREAAELDRALPKLEVSAVDLELFPLQIQVMAEPALLELVDTTIARTAQKIDERSLIRVDPGQYRVIVRDARGLAMDRAWSARPSTVLRIQLSAVAPVSPQPIPSNRSATREPEKAATPGLRRGAYVAFGSGGALLATSLASGLIALSLAQQVKSQCENNVCPMDEAARAQRAVSYARFATASFVGGIVGISAGALLLTLDLGGSSRSRIDASFEGLHWSGKF